MAVCVCIVCIYKYIYTLFQRPSSPLLSHQGWTGSKKRPWIFSQIGPPQLQYKQSLYLTILQQSCRIYGK